MDSIGLEGPLAVGTSVRVGAHHRIAERRGMVGKVVGNYGGERFVAVDVLFRDGERRLFWPRDLEEVPQASGASSSPRSWWGALLKVW